nr:hypothetical protein [Tanacetum cinerariifolium]
MAQPDNNTQLSSAFKTFFERETLTGINFNDWYRSLRIIFKVTDTYDYLYKPCPDQPFETASKEDKGAWKAEYKKHNDVACLMLRKMSPAFQKQFESYPSQLMFAELKKMFKKPQAVKIYVSVDALHIYKQAPGKSMSAHVLEMKGYMDQLHALGKSYDNDMVINLINRSLNKDFGDFVRNFNMHCTGKTVTELYAQLIDYEKGLKDKAPTPQCHTRRGTALFTSKSYGKIRTRLSTVLQFQGFKKERKLSYGEQYLQVGNGAQAAVEAIGVFDLVLPSSLILKLNNCYYAPFIVRGVVSLSCLLNLGFNHTIDSNRISVSLNGLFYFSAVSMNDVCGSLRHVSRKGASYFLTFTDDFSRYGYVYLLKHKHEQNGVSGRRNRTLLDMVRSMFNLKTLPLSFWDYALESVVHILNMVPTKNVDKTPYEIWHGKAPNFSYLKRSYILKVQWERYDLEDDHMDTLPFENTSEIPVESESLGSPPELIPVRMSERTTRAPNHLCLNIEVEDDEVGDLGEPTNYKVAMLNPDKVICQGTMDEEMNSMKVIKV